MAILSHLSHRPSTGAVTVVTLACSRRAKRPINIPFLCLMRIGRNRTPKRRARTAPPPAVYLKRNVSTSAAFRARDAALDDISVITMVLPSRLSR